MRKGKKLADSVEIIHAPAALPWAGFIMVRLVMHPKPFCSLHMMFHSFYLCQSVEGRRVAILMDPDPPRTRGGSLPGASSKFAGARPAPATPEVSSAFNLECGLSVERRGEENS